MSRSRITRGRQSTIRARSALSCVYFVDDQMAYKATQREYVGSLSNSHSVWLSSKYSKLTKWSHIARNCSGSWLIRSITASPRVKVMSI